MKRLNIALAILLPFFAVAQEDDVIMRALEDEMNRSREKLTLDECDPPFFVSYTLEEGETRTASATLGALMSKDEYPTRSHGIRVMVGDYDFNDESMDSDTRFDGSFYNDQMPMENDYDALRKFFWESTDNIYRRACKIHQEHLNFIERSEEPLDSLPYRTFARAEPVVYVEDYPSEFKPTKLSTIADQARDISTLFEAYPRLVDSYVGLTERIATTYMINSEGTKIKDYDYVATLVIRANIQFEAGDGAEDYLYYEAKTIDGLPGMKKIEKDIAALIENMDVKYNAEEIEDTYVGPVLFTDDAVYRLFAKGAINSFRASDIKAPNEEKSKSTYKSTYTPIDERLGEEEITSEHISVVLRPALEEFKGTELIGSFKYDSEGVAPKDSLVIIENGVLKNIMCSRTIAKDTHQSNGYNDGPGVVEIRSSEVWSDSKMRKKLLKMAKKADQDFAIVVKGFSANGREVIAYKVDLKSGEESLLKDVNLTYFSYSKLDDFVASSDRIKAYNTNVFESNSNLSIIAPDMMLFENISINPDRYEVEPEKPEVPSPLLAQ